MNLSFRTLLLFFSCRIADNAVWESSCLTKHVYTGHILTVMGDKSQMTIIPFRNKGSFGPMSLLMAYGPELLLATV